MKWTIEIQSKKKKKQTQNREKSEICQQKITTAATADVMEMGIEYGSRVGNVKIWNLVRWTKKICGSHAMKQANFLNEQFTFAQSFPQFVSIRTAIT